MKIACRNFLNKNLSRYVHIACIIFASCLVELSKKSLSLSRGKGRWKSIVTVIGQRAAACYYLLFVNLFFVNS